MRKIEKLKSRPVTDEELFKKINEMIEVINTLSVIKKTDDVYVGPQPGPYDLNALGKILKRNKR